MKVINNLLPENLANSLLKIAEEVVYDSGPNRDAYNVWTNLAWDNRIVGDSSLVVCIAVPDKILSEIDDCLIKNNILDPKLDKLLSDAKSAMLYVWTNGSYIPPHKDSTMGKAVTVYLNRSWSLSNGGLFCWRSNNEIRCVEPTFNVAIENTEKEEHFTTPVTTKDYLRVSLQIFIPTKTKLL